MEEFNGTGDYITVSDGSDFDWPKQRWWMRELGHFVSGHVDDIGRMSKVKMGDALKVEIEAPEKILHFLVEKGSVAVDGISLTVVDILKNSFTIVIIPHTAQFTTIGFKGPRDTVNIEVDIIGKYVARFLNRGMDKDARFMKTLSESGFIK